MTTTDLIERITAKHSLLNASLTYRGPEASGSEYAWEFAAQWETTGADSFNGRGVIGAYGADPVAAILNCASTIAIAQDGKWPVRLAPALQVAA